MDHSSALEGHSIHRSSIRVYRSPKSPSANTFTNQYLTIWNISFISGFGLLIYLYNIIINRRKHTFLFVYTNIILLQNQILGNKHLYSYVTVIEY